MSKAYKENSEMVEDETQKMSILINSIKQNSKNTKIETQNYPYYHSKFD